MSKEYYEDIFLIIINSHENYQDGIIEVLDSIKQTYKDSDGKMKATNTEYIKQIVSFIEKILVQDQYTALQKYLALKLLAESIEVKQNTLLVLVLKNQNLLTILEKYGKQDQTKPIFKIDPDKIGPYFMNLLLFSIKFWNSTWPQDASGKQTKFKELFEKLVNAKVKFPDKKMIHPQQAQAQTFQPTKSLNKPQINNDSINKINELCQSVIEVLMQQKKPKDCKDILNDYLNELQNAQTLILQISEEKISLNQQQRKKITDMEEFLNIYMDAYQIFSKQPNNDKNLQQFQNTVNENSHLITGLAIKKPANSINNYEEQKQQASQILQKDTDLLNHMIDICNTIISIIEQTTSAQDFKDLTTEYQVELQKNQLSLMEILLSDRFPVNLQKKAQDLDEFVQAYMEIYGVFSLDSSNNNFENLKLVVLNNQHLVTGLTKKVVTKQQVKIENTQSVWDFQSGFQGQTQNQNEEITNPYQYGQQVQNSAPQKQTQDRPQYNSSSQVAKVKPQNDNKMSQSTMEQKTSFNQIFKDSSQSIVHQQNKNQYLQNIEELEDEAIEREQKFMYKKQLLVQPIQQQKFSRKNYQNEEEFQENFSEISIFFYSIFSGATTIGVRDFPSRFQDILQKKSYKGHQVLFNPLIFASIETCGLTQRDIRRFKLSNIKAKCILYETPEIQIGVKSQSIYDILSNKNKLNLNIFIGNKTSVDITNLELEYQGDQTCNIWVSPQDQNRINPKNQLKEELIFTFTRMPYDLINAEFKFQINQKPYDGIFFIPNLLTRFMNFKDIDQKVFKNHWRLKQDNILKSEIFKINPNLIRHPSYFLRYFQKCMELTSLDEFIKQDDVNIKYYKLGGVFELDTQTIEYMIKISVRPDYTAVIQIIPFSTYVQTAETVINHLVYIFKKYN